MIEAGDKEERITSADEKDLTNAIAKAIRGREKAIYFLTGHGEAVPESGERDGYSKVKAALEEVNYVLHDTLLLVQALNPANRQAVVVQQPPHGLQHRYVLRSIEPAPPGPFHGNHETELGFPEAQHMLRRPDFLGRLGDRAEGVWALLPAPSVI